MESVKRHGRRRVSVSATELAQMGVCERLVVFEHQYGRRRTACQQTAIERGLTAHEKFYRDRHLDSVRKGRSRIALCLFGGGMDASTLWQILRRPAFPLADGRRLILIWCQMARVIRRWLGRAFRLKSWMNFCLQALDWCIGSHAQIGERRNERR